MGTMKGEEEGYRQREAGVKGVGGSGREKRVDGVKKGIKRER